MRTFSSKKYLGLTSLNNRTNSKNNAERGSSKANCLPAKENPWHGLPATIKSMS